MVTSFGSTINTFPQDVNPLTQDIIYIGQYANGKYTDGYVTKQDLKKSIIVSVSAIYTITAENDVIIADCTTAGFTVTLPTAAGIAGTTKTIKKINSANTLTIACTGGQTIDGASTTTLTSQWSKVILISDGTNWLTV